MGKIGDDFKSDVRINRFKLDIECEIHPSVYQYYSDLLADAKAEKDNEEDKLKLVESETDLFLRDNPPGGKPTEAMFKALVVTNKTVILQKKKVREIKKEVYVLESAVKALDHRKSQLGNLTELWSRGYFAQPNDSKKTGNDVAQIKTRKNLKKKGE